MPRPTIQDIAKVLGISGATVSRALRDDPRISEKVVREVKSTATLLGYVPNIAASSLRKGKTKLIGLIVRDIRDGFCLEVVPSIEAACANSQYSLLLCNAGASQQSEFEFLRTLLQRRVDGIILITPLTTIPDPYIIFGKEVPLVLVDSVAIGAPICTVSVDHTMGGYLSTKHLLELGHRKIAFLSGPLSLSSSLRCVNGYRNAMTEAGVPLEDQIVIITDTTDIQAGHDGMLEIIKITPRPTAVATFSDLMAAGALEAAHHQGISVPDELSIVGYDDIPLSSLLTPSITTIKQNKDELGKIAVRLLLDEIHDKGHVHQQIQIQPILVARDSSTSIIKEAASENYGHHRPSPF
jgi:LacI family transcriptional regulator, galactose operon repressor